jgi:hypothetical protein
MYSHVNPKNGQQAPLIAEDVFEIVMRVRSTCKSKCRITFVCINILSMGHRIDGRLFVLPRRLLMQNAERLDSEIIYNRDFDYDYFGFKVR